jgi:surface antigen
MGRMLRHLRVGVPFLAFSLLLGTPMPAAAATDAYPTDTSPTVATGSVGLGATVAVAAPAVPRPPLVGAAHNHFFAGYCTWLAAEHAHAEWGVWLPWFGDAGDWASPASAAGWLVTPLSTLGSIAAMPRGVQGSGRDGHVAWVIAVDPDDPSRVRVPSMSWSGYRVVTEHDIFADGLVQFISPSRP